MKLDRLKARAQQLAKSAHAAKQAGLAEKAWELGVQRAQIEKLIGDKEDAIALLERCLNAS